MESANTRHSSIFELTLRPAEDAAAAFIQASKKTAQNGQPRDL